MARKPFTQEERGRLASGQLVTRPVSEQRSGLRLIGGSGWQVIDAAPEVVFRALQDVSHYQRMLPGVSRVLLVSEHPTLRRVRVEHKRGPLGVSYRLALTPDASRREVTFKLNDPLDSGLRAAWGYLHVRGYGPDRSLLSYGVMADPGDGLIVGLVRGVIHDWMLKVPTLVKGFVESKTGRALYGSRPLGALRPCRGRDAGQPQQCAP